MAVVRFEPIRELERFIERVGDFFEEAGKGITLEIGGFVPRTNIWEDENAYYVEMELPGVKKEDLEISLREDGVLIVRGKKAVPQDERQYLRAERKFGDFQRSFAFPEPIDASGIAAELKDGVLTITLPKVKKEEPKAIKVEIQ